MQTKTCIFHEEEKSIQKRKKNDEKRMLCKSIFKKIFHSIRVEWSIIRRVIDHLLISCF